MSRIGKAPIPVPSGVDVTISDGHVTVKGPKGALERDIPEVITVRQEGDTLVVERPDDQRENRAMHGLVRSLVNNMVVGVTQGFTKELEIVGVGYRATARGPGALVLALGFSHPVNVEAPEGITFELPAPHSQRRRRWRPASAAAAPRPTTTPPAAWASWWPSAPARPASSGWCSIEAASSTTAESRPWPRRPAKQDWSSRCPTDPATAVPGPPASASPARTRGPRATPRCTSRGS